MSIAFMQHSGLHQAGMRYFMHLVREARQSGSWTRRRMDLCIKVQKVSRAKDGNSGNPNLVS